MDYKYEIIEALEDYYKNDTETLARILNELYQWTSVNEYCNTKDNICEANDICTKCFTSKVAKVFTERHGDNYTFDEKWTELACPKCKE